MVIHFIPFIRCPEAIHRQRFFHILSVDHPSRPKLHIRPFSLLERRRAFVARRFLPLPFLGGFRPAPVQQYCHGDAFGSRKVTSPDSMGPEGCAHPRV